MAKKQSSNNDINSILSQLKKSYNIDGNQEPEEDVFESDSYEDTELTSLLAKIIAENTFEQETEDAPEISKLHEENQEEPKKNKKENDSEHKPESLLITSEDFVSVLEDGEDISEGAKYTIPHPPLRTDVNNVEQEKKEETAPNDEEHDEQDDDAVVADAVEDEESLDELDGEDDITFGELEDELSDEIYEDDEINEDIEDVTFGELEVLEEETNEEDTDDITFGDLENSCEDETDDITFGDLEENHDITDIDENLTFADLADDESDTLNEDIIEESETDEDISEDDADEEDFSVIPTVEDITEEIEAKTEIIDDEEPEDVAENAQPQKLYYRVLEKEEREMSEEASENITDAFGHNASSENGALKQELEVDEGVSEEDNAYYADKYTDDPLQWHFTRKTKVTISEIVDDDEGEASKKTSEIQDDDISLLLQLGYKNELNTEVGQERTDFVVQNMSNSYRPDRHKIPFGFCGKEFCESEQIDKIKQKYDYDKRMIIIKTALFSAIAFVLLLLGIFFKTRTGITSMAIFPLIEIFIIALGCVVIYKELISGIVGIFKFTPTLFTIPIFSLVLVLVYDIFTIIVSSNSNSIDVEITPLFGFTTAIFFVISLVSELLNCIREKQTFNLIVSSEDLYAGEIFVTKNKSAETDSIRTHELRKQIKGEAVIVKKTKYISEFFKRNSESTYSILNVALTTGIVLLVSMVLAYIVIAAEDSARVADIASTIIFTVYMGLSASFILTMPMMLYSASSSLKRKKSGFVGTSEINEYAKTSTVIFPDTAAFNLGSDIEIVPFGDGDVKESLKTSSRVLTSLGGTLARTASEQSYSPDNSVSGATINIVTINNDGIELYMDNETHILLGNEKFMSTYRKRLDFEACDFIPHARTRDREVIYLAVNWSMSLGYIVTLKLKKSFIGVLEILSRANIRAMVSTYEPHIKSIHVSGIDIDVYKPYDYESPEKTIPRFGGIVAAEDSTNIIYPLIVSGEVTRRRKTLSLISLIFVLGGVLLSFAVTLIGYLVSSAYGILAYRDVLTAIIQICSIIPMTVHSVDIYKKYR